MKKIITLLTDFGTRDPYVASMKGVIFSINPEAKIVDITHQIPPQDILEAAYTLFASYKYFPKGTIHVIVVDPGVGSRRRIIALKTKNYIFIAPDNGVLSLVLQKEKVYPVRSPRYGRGIRPLQGRITSNGVKEIIEITNEKYFLKPVSDTFHGRDIFSPVAAYLSRGIPLRNFGKRIEMTKELKIATPEMKKGKLMGRIIHIDRFGNLVTNVDREILSKLKRKKPASSAGPPTRWIKIGKRRIQGIKKSYVNVGKGELLALFGSSGFLEISINFGNASKVLGMKRGEKIEVEIG